MKKMYPDGRAALAGLLRPSLLLGEVKWRDREPSQAELDRAVRALLAKGAPPRPGRDGADVRYALFVPRLPRKRPRHPNVHFLDAKDVLAVLR